MSAENHDEETGRRLREVREYLGFTQQQVADYLKVHRNTVVSLESGRKRVTADELVRMSRLYQRPVAYFVGDDEFLKLPDGMAEVIKGLDPHDAGELKKFAEFLHWRKRVSEEEGGGS